MNTSQSSKKSQTKEIDIAIIFPAFNEELTIEGTLREFHQELPDAQFWLIDNNSSDSTRAFATQVFKDLDLKGGIISERRQGKGIAMRTAFLEIEADIYVMVDADQTYPAEAVHALIQPVSDGEADIVVGDRHSNGDYKKLNIRPLHFFGNNLVKRLVNILYRSKLQDIMSGYRVMTKRFVKTCPILSNGFEIETEITLHALDKRLRLKEVSIRYRARPLGSDSKLNTIQDGARVIRTIFNIFRHYRPIVFFFSTGLALVILGLLSSIPVFSGYIQTGSVLNLPLAILATGLEISALISFTAGIILDSTIRHENLRFERNLLQWTSNSKTLKE
jgi:glycosyltransferase involved in cell wall biosynthesis